VLLKLKLLEGSVLAMRLIRAAVGEFGRGNGADYCQGDMREVVHENTVLLHTGGSTGARAGSAAVVPSSVVGAPGGGGGDGRARAEPEDHHAARKLGATVHPADAGTLRGAGAADPGLLSSGT
jgi:hypothetical protein